jgi:hypothetical protein
MKQVAIITYSPGVLGAGLLLYRLPTAHFSTHQAQADPRKNGPVAALALSEE